MISASLQCKTDTHTVSFWAEKAMGVMGKSLDVGPAGVLGACSGVAADLGGDICG